jgi:hypothetical protein
LDEPSSDRFDPVAYVFQSGVAWELTELVSLRTGLAYYDFHNVKGKTLDYTGRTNTVDSEGGLTYKYKGLSPSVEIKRENPAGGMISYVSLFGEYARNPNPPEKNQAYAAGLGIGVSKIKERGQWQLRYLYRHLEKDAWLDVFPDSDFYNGKTDVGGQEAVAQFGLFTNISLTLDYYRTQRLTGAREPTDLWQVDLSASF